MRAPRPGRRAGVPARRARDPRIGRGAAQASPGRHRGAAAVRAPVAGRAGADLPSARQRAPRGAGHQRGRDLADRAGHPLRGRQRPGAGQALFLAQQGRAAAHRAGQPGLGQSARRPLRPGRAGRLHPPVRRAGFQRARALYRSRSAALVAGLGDPADEGAEAGRHRTVSLRRGAAGTRGGRRLSPAAGAGRDRAVGRRRWRRGRLGRVLYADPQRPGAGQAAGGPAHWPHDPGRARPAVPGRDADHRLGPVGAGSARPSHAGARGGRGRSRQVRRRQVGVHFLPETVALVRRAGAAQGLAAQAGGAAAPEFPVADPAARVARRAYPAVGVGGRAGLARQPDRGHFRAAAPGAAVGPAGQYRLQERRGRPLPGRARDPLPYPPRLAPGEESGALGGRGRAGGNHPAVRALRGAHRADLAGTGGRAPAAQELVGPALGKEGRTGGRQRARHAVRPDHLYRPAHPLRPGQPQSRARAVHPSGAGAGRDRYAAGLRGAQPQADRGHREAGASDPPAGHPGRRRADLRLL